MKIFSYSRILHKMYLKNQVFVNFPDISNYNLYVKGSALSFFHILLFLGQYLRDDSLPKLKKSKNIFIMEILLTQRSSKLSVFIAFFWNLMVFKKSYHI